MIKKAKDYLNYFQGVKLPEDYNNFVDVMDKVVKDLIQETVAIKIQRNMKEVTIAIVREVNQKYNALARMLEQKYNKPCLVQDGFIKMLEQEGEDDASAGQEKMGDEGRKTTEPKGV